MSGPTACLAYAAVPVLRALSTEVRQSCCQEVGENSIKFACIWYVLGGSYIRRDEESKYSFITLSSICSPRLSSKASMGHKLLSATHSQAHKAPVSLADSGECWVSPVLF